MGPSRRRRYEPDSRVAALVERYGAPRVALFFALDADTLRRYLDGASRRATRWWIETHAETVARDLAAEARPALRLVQGSGGT